MSPDKAAEQKDPGRGEPARKQELDRYQRVDIVPELTKQFGAVLRAKFELVQRQLGEPSPADLTVIESIKSSLKEIEEGPDTGSWSHHYGIEHRLAMLYDDKTLKGEVDGKLTESVGLLKPERVTFHQASAQAAADDPGALRAVLLRLLDDTQWEYTKKEASRRFRRHARMHAGGWLMGGIGLFLVCYLLYGAFLTAFGWKTVALLLLVITAGCLGSTFSIQIGRRKELAESSFENLRVLRLGFESFPRLVFGMGAATILFFLIQSGLVAGKMFPRFERVDIQQASVESSLRRALEQVYGEDELFREALTSAEIGQQVEESAKVIYPLLRADRLEMDYIAEDRMSDVAGALASAEPLSQRQDWLRSSIIAECSILISESRLGLDFKNLMVLIVWAFLAGFSEKLVPGMLERAEAQASESKSDPT